jgi:hypothetical protein
MDLRFLMPDLILIAICRLLGFKLQALIFFVHMLAERIRRKKPQQGCTRMAIIG